MISDQQLDPPDFPRDSAYGRLSAADNELTVAGAELGADVVIESTGRFRARGAAAAHLKAAPARC